MADGAQHPYGKESGFGFADAVSLAFGLLAVLGIVLARVLIFLAPFALAAAAIVSLASCRTRLETAGGDTVVLTGRAERVTYRSAAGDQFELAGLSHAEETRAAGEALERVAKRIGRAVAFGKLFDAAADVGTAAFDHAAEVNADDNDLEGLKAVLDQEEAIETAP